MKDAAGLTASRWMARLAFTRASRFSFSLSSFSAFCSAEWVYAYVQRMEYDNIGQAIIPLWRPSRCMDPGEYKSGCAPVEKIVLHVIKPL